MCMFRDLRADEIECRVARVNEYGVNLLLYKDARCDMSILDETVGADRWQRVHDVVNGNLYCSVGIRFDREQGFGEWVYKQDVGVESNTEKEKGQASDSFKRACFNWGIGRELYTAPDIKIAPQDCNIKERNGKWNCYDSFSVQKIVIEKKRIVALAIKNLTTKRTCYIFQDPKWEAERNKGEQNA